MGEVSAQNGADETRSRVLASAAALYAEKGIDGVTTREIAERAKANIAAVGYHFGGKDKLSVEVFRKVCRESAERRNNGLDGLLAEAERTGAPPSIRAIVEIFVDAYIREDSRRDGILLSNLVLKHRIAPTAWTAAVVREELDPMARRFIAVLTSAAPHLSAEQVLWRYHMMVGAIVVTLSHSNGGERIERLSDGKCSLSDMRRVRDELVDFVTTAFEPTAA